MSRRRQLKTHEQVRAEFRESGVSIRQWAIKNGFQPSAVYTVLIDRRPAVRGTAHHIAVALGLKRADAQVGA